MKISLFLLALFLIFIVIGKNKEKEIRKLEDFGSEEIEIDTEDISDYLTSEITTTDFFSDNKYSTIITDYIDKSNNIIETTKIETTNIINSIDSSYTTDNGNSTNITDNIESTNIIDSSNIIESVNTADSSNIIESTNINNIPVNSDYPTDIPTPIKIKPKIILLGFGHFTLPNDNSLITFRAYFLKLYGDLSKYMLFTVTINNNGNEEQVNCIQINTNEDIIQYNCSFPANEYIPFENIYINRDFKFNDMEDDSLKPYIIYSSMANKTINGDLQNALDSDLDNGINILNETEITVINELLFKLIGNIKGTINNNNSGFLLIDENGDGKLKNITCNNIINREESLYDFNCQSDSEIYAPLTGVMGKTNKENKTILIYMKKENDILNLKKDIEKYLLVGFGHFNRNETILNFIAYVIKINGHIYPETLDLTIRIITNNSSRLRILDEIIQTIICNRITEINRDDMQFACNISIYSNELVNRIDNISRISRLDLVNSSLPNEANITYLGDSIDLESQSSFKLDNILIFKNAEIEINNTKFNIQGNIVNINTTNATLNNGEEVSFSIIDIKNLIKKNFSCSSNHQDKKNFNYIIDCNPNQTINANLHNAVGNYNNTNKSIAILLSDETKGLVNIFVPIIPIHYSSSKKGLSKGSLIAIFIACGLALMISIFISFLCRRRKPVYEQSETELTNFENNQTI